MERVNYAGSGKTQHLQDERGIGLSRCMGNTHEEQEEQEEQ